MNINPPSRVDELERLLIIAAESLDIPPGRHKDATDKYEAVGRLLAAEDSPLRAYDPQVYPHGSAALGTANKPVGRDEFDIDLICVLDVPSSISQKELKRLVGDRLKAFYKVPMLEEKNRCWRLNYAGAFHLDITPAKPNPSSATRTALFITDKDYRCWKDTDPKGYIAWFNVRKLISRRALTNEAKAGVEPAPQPSTVMEKMPLQIAIQLLKRHRDIHFLGRDDAPISIIITTLAGHAYQQEENILLTMRGLLERMPSFIDYSIGQPRVLNPTNVRENFADKWISDPRLEKAFFEWIDYASKDLGFLESKSIGDVGSVLDRFLGPKRKKIVMEKWAAPVIEKRASGLYVSGPTGALGTTGILIPRNSNFGD